MRCKGLISALKILSKSKMERSIIVFCSHGVNFDCIAIHNVYKIHDRAKCFMHIVNILIELPTILGPIDFN